jgi:hypothetical protein
LGGEVENGGELGLLFDRDLKLKNDYDEDAPDSGIIGGAVVSINGGIGHTALGGSIAISSAYGGAVFGMSDAALLLSTEAANAGKSGVVDKRSGSSSSGSVGDIAILVGSSNDHSRRRARDMAAARRRSGLTRSGAGCGLAISAAAGL